MVRFLLTLVVIALLAAGTVWFLGSSRDRTQLETTGERMEEAARAAGENIRAKLASLKLSDADITNELAQTGRVIREKADHAGRVLAEATADARVTALIKAKLARDPDLSAWDISVNTTDGIVTLSGSVSSPEKIGKAMALALETEGVRQVHSTMQLKAKG